ncbi:MAG: NAD(P)-dependent dehydrogenase (short-subunit alcohol dehydrogenase family) [Candidatus Azotimanducaceae bacterium]|jgi:NAD(P)-dependent dehydrogenase (short-subunit alcohol dehydrogenase family)
MGDRVAGKVAIVTGGASGIGRGCVMRLAEEGAIVVITDVDVLQGQALADELAAQGKQVKFVEHDVTQESQWEAVIAATLADFKDLHVLVNNAGIAVGGSILDMTLETWRHQQAINLDGVFLGIKYAIPAMIESGGGSIVNMSSVAGLKGSAKLAAYNATKGGVRLLTKGVALECAQSHWNIRVNSVHPGVINTPIWQKVNPEFLEEGDNAVDVEQLASAGVPSGELGLPLDIANGVLYLASDESRYVTGSELVIDGGISA